MQHHFIANAAVRSTGERTLPVIDPSDGQPVFEGGERPPGTARILRYANTEVTVAVDSPHGGWLVLNDSWHPWWYATVDGAPTPVRRANAILRAVMRGETKAYGKAG